jgi:N-acetylmuramic acid 6-phosphate etherase
MVVFLTGRSEVEVEAALGRAEGSVKLAVLLLRGCDRETAHSVLQRAGGRLRAAIDLVADAGACSADTRRGETPSRK